MATKVFVSSTYVDLSDTRELVCDCLKEMQLQPVLFEKGGIHFDFTKPLDKSCYDKVRECAIYVLIIGSKYGSKANQEDLLHEAGSCEYNSITRREWLEAKNTNIPIFIYVKEDVLNEYDIFKSQNDKDSYTLKHVDDKNVFGLIEDIFSQAMNNFVTSYKTPSDIVNTFKKQASGLLASLIEDKRKSLCVVSEEEKFLINCYTMFYFRKEKGLSFPELSKLTGINKRRLEKIEREKKKPNNDGVIFHECDLGDICKLEDIFGASRGDLIFRKTDLSAIEAKTYYYKNKLHKKSKEIDPNVSVDKKVVVFDFDGTLTHQNRGITTWGMLWEELGYPISECGKYHKKFSSNEITHKEWCDITKEKFVEKGISPNTLVDVANKIKLLDGVEETFKCLYEKGVDIYILSGSIEKIIKLVLSDSFEYIKQISANDLKFKGNDLLEIRGTKYDFEGKSDFIEEKIEELGIKPNEVMFVGNSFNDKHAHLSGAETLCINPYLVNPYTKVWTYHEEDGVTDLTKLKKYFLPSRYGRS